MLFILQDTSVYKIPSFRTGPWDHTGSKHSYCRHLQFTHGSAPHWPWSRKVSQVQNQLCAPHSDAPLLMCALPPGALSLLPLHALEAALNLWRVHHPPTGEFGVGFRASAVALFPPYFALVRKFLSSILAWLGQWKGEGRWKEMVGLPSPFLLLWGAGSQGWWQRSCPAATLVSRRFLSSLGIELCRCRAAAGGWEWIPQGGRKAGNCLLTS